jgi:ABC-type uncharacterized transport system involved in gliding motility auxiliary subunit
MNKLGIIGAILALVVLFFAVNMLAGPALSGRTIDLTQGKLYTLTAGSKSIAAGLTDPITLTYYFSAKGSQGNPMVQTYGQRVLETLHELVRAGKGKITLKVVDPIQFSDAEDDAIKAGMAQLPVGPKGENLYLGLVGTNSIDGKETLPFLSPEKERFLEYDLSRLVYTLAHPEKKTVGIMTALPIEGSAFNPRTMQPTRAQPWAILNEIKGLYEYKKIEPTATEIPTGVDVLMVVHPKKLSDATLYAIDQFVMSGGRLLAFTDPFCENDPAGQNDQFGGMGQDKSSDLNKLLNAWGVETVPGQVVTDKTFALQVNANPQGREIVSFVAWLGVTKQGMSKDDPVTGQLSRMNIASPGAIRKKEATKAADGKPEETPAVNTGPSVEIVPLISSSKQSQMIDSMRLAFQRDPKELLGTFISGEKELTLAARLSGKVKSAFPNGRPAPAPDDKTPPPANQKPHMNESSAPIQAIVVADCDMLADMFWTQAMPLNLGITKMADNGDFVTNAIDNLIGNTDLISIRARGEFARPFTVVQEMEKSAEQKSQARMSLLQQQLDEAERNIQKLESQRPDQQGMNAMMLTPEQKTEIEKFRQQQIAARKDLRKEKLSLRQDIETLFGKLKFINIGLMPVLVSIAALMLGGYRVAHRTRDRRTVSKAE